MSEINLNAALGRWGMEPLDPETEEKFSAFQGLLEHWNARINLTSIRNPEEQVSRHLLESIFCARHLREGVHTLLDFGSGAGFPGIPIALCCPGLKVTLGESQGKKAAFLREAIRTLGLRNATVFDGRIEEMEPARVFDAVTMRAVDRMQAAISHGADRVDAEGVLILFASVESDEPCLPEFERLEEFPIPESERRVLTIWRRVGLVVPRGTRAGV